MDGYALYHAIHFLVGERIVRCVAEGEREAEAQELGNHDERQCERRILHSLQTFQKPEAWIICSRIRRGDRDDAPGTHRTFQLGEEVQVVLTRVRIPRDVGDGQRPIVEDGLGSVPETQWRLEVSHDLACGQLQELEGRFVGEPLERTTAEVDDPLVARGGQPSDVLLAGDQYPFCGRRKAPYQFVRVGYGTEDQPGRK